MTATGGTGVITYTLTPAIPGLTLNPTSRVLTGTPTTVAGATMHSYTATDGDMNTATLTVSITVNAAATTVPTFGDATIGDLTYAIGTAVDLTLPVATGGGVFYSVRGATLPDGLTFTPATRVLMHSYRHDAFASAVAPHHHRPRRPRHPSGLRR